jgi:hypothetical protein
LHVTEREDDKKVTYNAGERSIGWDIDGSRNDDRKDSVGELPGWIVQRT